MVAASKEVLDAAVLDRCSANSSSRNINAPNCMVWYNYCPSGRPSYSSGQFEGACNAYNAKEIHEQSESPIDEGASWIPSGQPAVYNFRVWRQRESGTGWIPVFERQVGADGEADRPDSNPNTEWFYGKNSGGALFYSTGNQTAGPFGRNPKNAIDRVCYNRFKSGDNGTKGSKSTARKDWWRNGGYPNKCYWEGGQVGSAVFGGSSSPTKFNNDVDNPGANAENVEAISFRWKSGSSSKFYFAIDSPGGYYYIIQIVAMDKREQIMPAPASKPGRYPYNRSNCNATAPKRIRSSFTDAGRRSYAVYWCGNYLQAYMPNPAEGEADESPSRAELNAPKVVKTGEDAVISVSLRADALSWNSAVFPRYARLQHFTPQITYSNSLRLINSGGSVKRELGKTYGSDFVYYDTDPSDVDRLGAPPIATGPPDKYGNSNSSQNWWMTSAQLIKPMNLVEGYDGSGMIANADFSINWRAPTVESPCRVGSENLPWPKAGKLSSSGETELVQPWPSSPQSCDEYVTGSGQDAKLESDVFNAWDDWLIGLVVREERVGEVGSGSYGYSTSSLPLRCGSYSEFDDVSWRSVSGSDCTGDNSWNSLVYTPLANRDANSPAERANNGSMQFAQGYVTVRGLPCRGGGSNPKDPYYCGPTESNPNSNRGVNAFRAATADPASGAPTIGRPSDWTPANWRNRLKDLKWWEKGALRVKADTNRRDNVSGFVAWPRQLTAANGFRNLPGNNAIFSALGADKDLLPFSPGTNLSAPLGREQSNTSQWGVNGGRNTVSNSFELNFCRQALPAGTNINTAGYTTPAGYTGAQNPNDDIAVENFLSDENPGSSNCAGWASKWEWDDVDVSDTYDQCTAQTRDVPSIPSWTKYSKPFNLPGDAAGSTDTSASPALGASTFGAYHSANAQGEYSYDPTAPTSDSQARPSRGQAGSSPSRGSQRFYGAPYTNPYRPGQSIPSSDLDGRSYRINPDRPDRLYSGSKTTSNTANRYVKDCDENIREHARPVNGSWQQKFRFFKKPIDGASQGGVPYNDRTPTNCRFTLAQIYDNPRTSYSFYSRGDWRDSNDDGRDDTTDEPYSAYGEVGKRPERSAPKYTGSLGNPDRKPCYQYYLLRRSLVLPRDSALADAIQLENLAKGRIGSECKASNEGRPAGSGFIRVGGVEVLKLRCYWRPKHADGDTFVDENFNGFDDSREGRSGTRTASEYEIHYAYGFWYRYRTEWVWDKDGFTSSGQLQCHVGLNKPLTVTGPEQTSTDPDTGETLTRPATELRSSTNRTSSSRGATFALSEDATSSQGVYGSNGNNLVFSGTRQAWSERVPAAPGGPDPTDLEPASAYTDDDDKWWCNYKKKGYIVNSPGAGVINFKAAGQWRVQKQDSSGRWQMVPGARSAGSGWGVNNTGPRLDTGYDYNSNNVPSRNTSPTNPKRINYGAGYMVQLAFDRLTPGELVNQYCDSPSNCDGLVRSSSAQPTAGAPSNGLCPLPTNFYKGRVLGDGQSTKVDDSRTLSRYSGPGTCWRMVAWYDGFQGLDWKFRIARDEFDSDKDNAKDPSYDPKEMQARIKVISSRDTR